MENKHTRSVSLIDGHIEDRTDAEIIKALECCSANDCKNCPYDKHKVCGVELSKDALDLIKRQQAEIERLKAESDMADGYEDALVEMTKSEAIKEFAERAENISVHGKIDIDDFFDLVKEMTEVSE